MASSPMATAAVSILTKGKRFSSSTNAATVLPIPAVSTASPVPSKRKEDGKQQSKSKEISKVSRPLPHIPVGGRVYLFVSQWYKLQ